MTSTSGGSPLSRQAFQSSLESAIRDVRDVVEKKLRDHLGARGHSAPPDPLESLHRALEELNVAWENLNAQSEQVVREREHFAQLFRLAPDAYVVTDPYGAIRQANAAAQTLLRLSTPQLAGKPLQLFVTAEHLSAFRTNLSDLLSERTATAKTWTGGLRRGESPMWVEFTVCTIQSPDEAVLLCWVLRPLRVEGGAA